MTTWKDKNGLNWQTEITVKTLKNVRSKLGIDLMQVKESIEKIIADVYLLVDVLFVIHESECEKRGVTADDFGDLICGDSVAEATQAFIDALINFFPSQQRDLLAKISKKRQEIEAQILEKTGKEIDKLNAEEIAKTIG